MKQNFPPVFYADFSRFTRKVSKLIVIRGKQRDKTILSSVWENNDYCPDQSALWWIAGIDVEWLVTVGNFNQKAQSVGEIVCLSGVRIPVSITSWLIDRILKTLQEHFNRPNKTKICSLGDGRVQITWPSQCKARPSYPGLYNMVMHDNMRALDVLYAYSS